jgi:TATA-box binding protein (TBP) (component of TFIID and TFIIIB)
MYKSVANLSFQYLLTLDEFRKSFKLGETEPRPSYLKITTITMTAKFDVDERFDTAALKQKLQALGRPIRLKRRGAKGTKPSEWTVAETSFMNQCTLTNHDGFSQRSIKIFKNGSIQCAGCTDLFDCVRVISQLRWFFATFFKIETRPESFKIAMINSNFSMNRSLNLANVVRTFNQYPQIFQTSFDPDRYAAVKIKFSPFAESTKQLTTSIFSTGKIIITGGQTLKEVSFAYNQVAHALLDHPETLMSPTEETDVDVFDTFYGYDAGKLIARLREKGFHSWKDTITNREIKF